MLVHLAKQRVTYSHTSQLARYDFSRHCEHSAAISLRYGGLRVKEGMAA